MIGRVSLAVLDESFPVCGGQVFNTSPGDRLRERVMGAGETAF